MPLLLLSMAIFNENPEIQKIAKPRSSGGGEGRLRREGSDGRDASRFGCSKGYCSNEIHPNVHHFSAPINLLHLLISAERDFGHHVEAPLQGRPYCNANCASASTWAPSATTDIELWCCRKVRHY